MSSVLFSPITLAGLDLANRIAVAPMCQYSADEGTMSDWHLVNLGQFAMSGPGLVIIEATGLEPCWPYYRRLCWPLFRCQ